MSHNRTRCAAPSSQGRCLRRARRWSAIALTLWWISFNRNCDLIAATNNDIAEYRTLAQPVLRETTVVGPQFLEGPAAPAQAAQHADRLRRARGARADHSRPSASASGSACNRPPRRPTEIGARAHVSFAPDLPPRGAARGNINNPGFVYEALKVYMMVGGPCPWTGGSSWPGCATTGRKSFRAPANARGRQALEEHLQAMFDLDVGQSRPSRSTRR